MIGTIIFLSIPALLISIVSVTYFTNQNRKVLILPHLVISSLLSWFVYNETCSSQYGGNGCALNSLIIIPIIFVGTALVLHGTSFLIEKISTPK
jgi:hypothetical protein